jgi:hypothetical protein
MVGIGKLVKKSQMLYLVSRRQCSEVVAHRLGVAANVKNSLERARQRQSRGIEAGSGWVYKQGVELIMR